MNSAIRIDDPREALFARLAELERDLERRLGERDDEDLRNELAIARGHIELATRFGDPIPWSLVVVILARAGKKIGTGSWLAAFLLRLRVVEGQLKFSPVCA